MPRSKRRKIISLTQTKKKGIEQKQNLLTEIRKCINDYERIFIYTMHHVRTKELKQMRIEWRHSKFFMGKNKVMSLALGKTAEEELGDNLNKLSNKLVGQCGLLFTNKTKEEVLEYFEKKRVPVAPHSGDMAPETVELKAGPLEQFPHNMEPYLRKLGMPTRLWRAVPELLQDYTVCEEGKRLTPNQANILRHLGLTLATFYLEMEYMWCKDGTFEKLGTKPDPEPKKSSGKTQGKRKMEEREDEDSEDEDEEEGEDGGENEEGDNDSDEEEMEDDSGSDGEG